MNLYEKSGKTISIYELKVLRDKLFEYKRKVFDGVNKDEVAYKILSNNVNEINGFLRKTNYDMSQFISKKNSFFIHKDGLKLDNYNYAWGNKVIIDGLIYQVLKDDFFLVEPIIINGDAKKYLLPTTHDYNISSNKKRFDGEYYKYELPNLVSIPRDIILLNKLLKRDWEDLVDKDIDEQLSLFEFNDEPVAKLDVDTLEYVRNHSMDYYLFDDGLEVSQTILKKVRDVKKHM